MENKSIEKLALAIYSNKAFADNFAPYEPEFFPITKEIKIRNTFERFSEFEAENLIKKFNWFRNLNKFKIKKFRKTDLAEDNGYQIILNGNQVGFAFERPEGYKLGFCLEDKESEGGFKWHYYVLHFAEISDIEKYLKIYYGKLQDKYHFFVEKSEVAPEVKETKDNDYDW